MLPEGFRRVFRLPASRSRISRDVQDEIAFHLAMREERLRALGHSDADARAGARKRFGDVARVADECQALGIAGRAFTERDRPDAPPVAIVNETLARRYLLGAAGGAGAINRRVLFDGERWLTVVGVVADVHYAGAGAPVEPAVYVPFAQDPFVGMNMFLRTTGEPLAVLPSVRRAMLALDPELPLSFVRTLEEYVGDSITQARFNMAVVTLFAALAFGLAAIGIYGVVAYGVARSRHEMGVRLALGVQGNDVLRLVAGRALRPAVVGVVVGLGAAVFATRALDRLLFGTSSRDPITYAAVAVALLAVAAFAAYLPGRRGAAADPLTALRSE